MRKIEDNPEVAPVKLTVKDRRIIGELFGNGRASFAEVGKKVRMSKESAGYRVKRLQELGLLVGFNTVLDIERMGWKAFFVYLKFRNVDEEADGKIFSYLRNHSHVAQLFRTIGNYDAVLKVFVREYADVGRVAKEIGEKLRESIAECRFDYLAGEVAVPFSFLYSGKPARAGGSRIAGRSRKGQEAVPLDSGDLKILAALAKNARLPLSDAARALGLSRDFVKYRLRRMEEAGVILAYRPDTLPARLGYNWHFLLLKVERLSPELDRKLVAFLTGHPNVTYFYRTVGESDVEVELRTRTHAKLNELLLQIRGILRAVLKRSEILIVLEELKYTYMPGCMLEQKE